MAIRMALKFAIRMALKFWLNWSLLSRATIIDGTNAILGRAD